MTSTFIASQKWSRLKVKFPEYFGEVNREQKVMALGHWETVYTGTLSPRDICLLEDACIECLLQRFERHPEFKGLCFSRPQSWTVRPEYKVNEPWLDIAGYGYTRVEAMIDLLLNLRK